MLHKTEKQYTSFTSLGLPHCTFALRQQQLSPLTLMARQTSVSEVVGKARSSLQGVLGGEADSISLTLCDSNGLELAGEEGGGLGLRFRVRIRG